MKKIFEKIIPGSLSVYTRRVSTENAPEGDSKGILKAADETFGIASREKKKGKNMSGRIFSLTFRRRCGRVWRSRKENHGIR